MSDKYLQLCRRKTNHDGPALSSDPGEKGEPVLCESAECRLLRANENRISHEKCPMAKTLLGIAVAEMMHLQKLGELICLLGGKVDFVARPYNGRPRMWTPECLTLPEHVGKMLQADIEAEEGAIKQYHMHIKVIDDDCVNAVLRRIIQDEEYHVMLLQALARE